MKIFLFIILVFHGLIHLMGFVKAFNLAEIDQLTQPITRTSGVFWLLTMALLAVAAILLLSGKGIWWMPATLAILFSQVLVIQSWQDAKFGTAINVVLLVAVIIGYGTWSFSRIYEKDVVSGLARTATVPASLLTEADITSLPDPVKRYIRYAGAIGKPAVHNFRIAFTGKIRKNEQSDWMPFTSVQYNFLEPATRLFFMKATMKHLPIAGFHCFKNGTAYMDIRLFSLFKVQYMEGKEMNIAETVTFFNDMCCMAPATLVDKRIRWTETDGNKVKAEFTNNNITISAWLYFNDMGELVNFISGDRYATGDNNSMTNLPWSTPLKGYKNVDGYRLAGDADAVYTYPEGDLCYGKFSITGIEYNSNVCR
ncbi:MAG: hypothetical protein NT040_08665 [Bacteroidetes bacterium]|nr:hypothetical protein [Bacteroidota bacterium]